MNVKNKCTCEDMKNNACAVHNKIVNKNKWYQEEQEETYEENE